MNCPKFITIPLTKYLYVEVEQWKEEKNRLEPVGWDNEISKTRPKNRIVTETKTTNFFSKLLFRQSESEIDPWIVIAEDTETVSYFMEILNGFVANLLHFPKEKSETPKSEQNYYGCWPKLGCREVKFMHVQNMKNDFLWHMTMRQREGQKFLKMTVTFNDEFKSLYDYEADPDPGYCVYLAKCDCRQIMNNFKKIDSQLRTKELYL